MQDRTDVPAVVLGTEPALNRDEGNISADEIRTVLTEPTNSTEPIVALPYNDEVRSEIFCSTCRPNPKLNCDRSPYIWTLRDWSIYSARDAGRSWFRDDVKKDFTYLTGSGSDSISFFILKGVDPAVEIKG